MSHGFKSLAYREDIKTSKVVSNGKFIKKELSFKTFNFRRNMRLP